jgi:D-amino-acid dehydrogenase
MNFLLDRIQKNGAQFMWNETGNSIKLNDQKNVVGIETENGLLKTNHYVISPGAYGNPLLNGTLSENKIHGNSGVWLELPNLEPQLKNSLKLRRTGHITEAANITVTENSTGKAILILGSGYGYTGVNPKNIDEHLLDKLYHGLIDTAQKYFPKAYESAIKADTLKSSFKFCVRPWTANSLGIFEIISTDTNGKCVITGGHNTGGFAQAPSIANAVLAALNDNNHAMHSLYNPIRSAEFLP